MTKTYKLEDLDCANCAAKMEDGIKKIKGVKSASVNFLLQKMTVDFEGDEKEVMKTIVKECKRIEPDCTILL